MLKLWGGSQTCPFVVRPLVLIMRRLLAFSFLLTTLLALVSAGFILLTRNNPDSAELHIFPFTECRLPCFLGAVPGKTTLLDAFEETSKRLGPRGYILDEQYSPFIWKKPAVLKSITPTIGIDFNNKVFEGFSVGFDPDDRTTPTLANVISVLDAPSCYLYAGRGFDVTTRRVTEAYNIYILRKDYRLTIVSDLKFDHAIYAIFLESAPNRLDCPNASSRWRGLKSAVH